MVRRRFKTIRLPQPSLRTTTPPARARSSQHLPPNRAGSLIRSQAVQCFSSITAACVVSQVGLPWPPLSVRVPNAFLSWSVEQELEKVPCTDYQIKRPLDIYPIRVKNRL